MFSTHSKQLATHIRWCTDTTTLLSSSVTDLHHRSFGGLGIVIPMRQYLINIKPCRSLQGVLTLSVIAEASDCPLRWIRSREGGP